MGWAKQSGIIRASFLLQGKEEEEEEGEGEDDDDSTSALWWLKVSYQTLQLSPIEVISGHW